MDGLSVVNQFLRDLEISTADKSTIQNISRFYKNIDIQETL